MEHYDWLVVAQSMKDVLRCATMKHGEPSVMMDLTPQMQQSFADNWDSRVQVNTIVIKQTKWIVYLHHFTGAVAQSNAAFGQGTGNVLVTTIQCTGNETSLIECPGAGFLDNQPCQHTRDAGVTCQRRQCERVQL